MFVASLAALATDTRHSRATRSIAMNRTHEGRRLRLGVLVDTKKKRLSRLAAP